MSDHFHIYVDGSFSADTGTGGWAFVVYRKGIETASDFGRMSARNNGHMEVLALLRALEWTDTSDISDEVVVWCDSHYVVDGCNRLLKIWRTNGWKRVVTNPRERKRKIPDLEQWQAVDLLLTGLIATTIKWCKGHSGNPGNEQADALASARSLNCCRRRP